MCVLIFSGGSNKVPQTKWHKQLKFIVLGIWWLEVQDEGMGRSGCFRGREGEYVSGPMLASGGFPAIFAIPWLPMYHQRHCLHLHMVFSLHLYPVSPFYKDTKSY